MFSKKNILEPCPENILEPCLERCPWNNFLRVYYEEFIVEGGGVIITIQT